MKLKALSAGVAVSILALGLAGCSGGPSDGDVENAVKSVIEQQNAQLQRMGAGSYVKNYQTEVHSVKKLGCKAAENTTGYNCDVQVDVTAPMVGRKTNTATLRFIKGEKGWEIGN